MVTKGYGWTVDMIDWSCPADLEPYAKAYELQRKEMDSYIYSAMGSYGISGFMFAIDHCFSGRKASTKYVPRPITVEADPNEAAKREMAKAEAEMLRIQVNAVNQKLMEMDKTEGD